jgi:RNA polymerase sigma-70 factor (ECF subfamily)
MSEASQQAQAWKEWLAAHGGRLLLFARGWAPSREDAEDLVQEAVLRLWHYQAERGGSPPDLPLAFTTLRFCGLNHHRSETRRQRREEAVIYFNDFRDVWLDPAMENDEEGELLQDALKRIPEKLHEVVVMKVWGGLTFAEIAQTLAISPNTAASRYRYALERLAGELESVRKARYGVG